MSPLDNVLVIVTTLVLATAVATSVALIVDARRDLGAIRAREISNGRRIVAVASMRTEILRLVSTLALATYVVSVAVDAVGHIGRFAFVVAAAAILAQSVSVYAMRRRLFDRYRRPFADADRDR